MAAHWQKTAAIVGCLLTALAATGSAEPFAVSIRVDAGKRLGRLEPIWRFFGADEPNYAYLEHGRKLLGELGELGANRDGEFDRGASPLPDRSADSTALRSVATGDRARLVPPRRGEGAGGNEEGTPRREEGAGGNQTQGVYFRAHNLLTSGDGTPALKWGSTGVYREDAEGRILYDWTILDRIFDAYRDAGVRPYVQMGFMPRELSTRPEPYQHRWNPQLGYNEIFTGWAYPPKDYEKWAALIHAWVKHAIERYGRDEVDQWYWETWNEANIGYWQGTREEFFKLHDYSVDAVRRALPTARVGGPDSAGSGGDWTRAFLEHCLRGTNHATGETGTPLDFVAFHAKGAPRQVDGHVRMGIAEQLRTIDDGFRIVESFPELKSTPIIIGECDPEGCAACQGPQLAYRNGTMYSSYTAAIFSRLPELAARHGVTLEWELTWAFEFEGQPLFAGFRSLATGGIDKPVLNVFRMFSMMGGERVKAESDHASSLGDMLRDGVRGEPDVGAMASLDGGRLCVLVWHYHDDDVAGADAAVEIEVEGLDEADGDLSVKHYRVDETHSHAFTAWKAMGSPAKPTAEQYAALEKAGRLAAPEVSEANVQEGQATIKFALPRKGVALLVMER